MPIFSPLPMHHIPLYHSFPADVQCITMSNHCMHDGTIVPLYHSPYVACAMGVSHTITYSVQIVSLLIIPLKPVV